MAKPEPGKAFFTAARRRHPDRPVTACNAGPGEAVPWAAVAAIGRVAALLAAATPVQAVAPVLPVG